MSQRGLLFSYSGALTAEIITSLLHLLDNKLKIRNVGIRRKKNIVNIAIECLQNIHYHGLPIEDGDGSMVDCLVALVRYGSVYDLIFSNKIMEADAILLDERLTYLNNLNNEELHHEYLNILNRGILSAKGGGGLGLIRILRESGKPINYSFEQTESPNVVTLNLTVTVTVDNPIWSNIATTA